MTSDWGLPTMSPKMLVRPIRARKARPHMGHECVGAAVKVEVTLALRAAISSLYHWGPSVFCRESPCGDFAKPSWTVLNKRLPRTGVYVPVFEGLFDAVFEMFCLRPSRALVLILFSIQSRALDSSCFGSRLTRILAKWPVLSAVGGCGYSRPKRKVSTFLKL